MKLGKFRVLPQRLFLPSSVKRVSVFSRLQCLTYLKCNNMICQLSFLLRCLHSQLLPKARLSSFVGTKSYFKIPLLQEYYSSTGPYVLFPSGWKWSAREMPVVGHFPALFWWKLRSQHNRRHSEHSSKWHNSSTLTGHTGYSLSGR